MAHDRATSNTEIWRKASAFGMYGEEVDGMDVEAVKRAAEKAVKHAREGKGPYILEMKTYRYRGHSMSDPAKYRTREEVDAMRKQHDPIDQLREVLHKQNVTEDRLKDIDADVKAIVLRATEFAQTSPEPDPSELFTDILIPVGGRGAGMEG